MLLANNAFCQSSSAESKISTVTSPVSVCQNKKKQLVHSSLKTEDTTAIIRHYEMIPVGWRRVDAIELDDTSGPPIMWVIGRYDHLPVGATFVMLSEDPTPAGWEVTSSIYSTNPSQKTIIRRK